MCCFWAWNLSRTSLQFPQFSFHCHPCPMCFLSSRNSSVSSPLMLHSTFPKQFWFCYFKTSLLYNLYRVLGREGRRYLCLGHCHEPELPVLWFWIWIWTVLYLLSWVYSHLKVNNKVTLEGHILDTTRFSILSSPSLNKSTSNTLWRNKFSGENLTKTPLCS